VKGGDYTVETIVGAPLVLGWGGRVETVPLAPGRSTTSILQGLRGDERR
jgi:bifunctional ADP-heptose synthase (sugar kinase/adenylyltransferase)